VVVMGTGLVGGGRETLGVCARASAWKGQNILLSLVLGGVSIWGTGMWWSEHHGSPADCYGLWWGNNDWIILFSLPLQFYY
jgi:hypothetical protein